jgi:hypothetical protein
MAIYPGVCSKKENIPGRFAVEAPISRKFHLIDVDPLLIFTA